MSEEKDTLENEDVKIEDMTSGDITSGDIDAVEDTDEDIIQDTDEENDEEAATDGSDDLESLIEQLEGIEGVKSDLGDMSVEALKEIAMGVSEDMLNEMLDVHMREDEETESAKIESRLNFISSKEPQDEAEDAETASQKPLDTPSSVDAEQTPAEKPEQLEQGEPRDGSFDYLGELGAPAEAEPEFYADGIDILGSSQSKSLKSTKSDLFDIAIEDDSPSLDFSFNESFTTGADGGGVVKKGIKLASHDDDENDDQALLYELEREAKKKPKIPLGKRLRALLFEKVFSKVSSKASSVLPEPVKQKLIVVKKKVLPDKKVRLSQKASFIVTISVMILILLVSSIFLLRNFRALRELNQKTKVVVDSSEARLNYANFIFAGITKQIGRNEITLTKLIADEYMNVFYFDKYIPEDRFFAELRDDLGNYYCLYRPGDGFVNSVAEDEAKTVFWFDGTDRAAKKLFLTIWDKHTNNEAVFEVDMNGYSLLSAKYLQSSKGSRTIDNNLSVIFESGAFSSSMSTIVYRLSDIEGIPIAHGEETGGGASGSARLENTLNSVGMLSKRPTIYKISDDLSIGRLDFGPVRSLKNNATLTLSELYRYGEIDQTINAASLFEMSDGDSVNFETKFGQLVLEGMRKMDNKFILVYHLKNRFGEKMLGEADIDLYVKTYTGVEIKLDSYVVSGIEGGDMIFSYDSPNSIIDNYEPENIYLKVNDITFGVEDVTSEFALSGFSNNKNEKNNVKIEQFVEAAFEKRLLVKAGELAAGSLSTHFSGELLESPSESNELYAPLEKQYDSMEAGIMVHTISNISRNEYFAVAEVSWLGISGSGREHFYQTHELIIRQNGDNFVIISDTVREF